MTDIHSVLFYSLSPSFLVFSSLLPFVNRTLYPFSCFTPTMLISKLLLHGHTHLQVPSPLPTPRLPNPPPEILPLLTNPGASNHGRVASLPLSSMEARLASCSRCAHVTPGPLEDAFSSPQELSSNKVDIIKILQNANSIIPHIVLASTILAMIFPPSLTWFTTRYYAPALGFLMFAVGLNSSGKDFLLAIKQPGAITAGYIGQFIIKPALGYLFGTIAVTAFNLPASIGAGIMLVSCVSGAQLSNYATFLTDPPMAPLSIVMTSLSTATAALVTPLLSLLLIGKRLPVDVKGMMSSIVQIVVIPIATGLLMNKFFPKICSAIQPFLPPLSVFVTALCVGSPLAINIDSILSPFGITILLLITGFHLSAFIAGYILPGVVFHKASDVKALQRTLSFEMGMQSSLLALALANKFFQDPLVGVPPAISVVIMSLMGFSLVMLWARKKEHA